MARLKVVEHGRVDVADGRITFVGDADSGMPADAECVDAGGRCLLPGFVDSHTHFIFGGLRAEEFSWRLKGESYMSIMRRGGGIVSTVEATRKMSPEEMMAQASHALHRMERMGITTVEGKSGYGLNRDTELLQLDTMRRLNGRDDRSVDVVPTFLGAHAVPKEYAGRTDDYVDFLIEEILPVVAERHLAEFCDVFCEDGVFSIEQSRRLLKAAQAAGLRLKIHADEIVSLGGAELAAELNAVSADHLLHVSDEGIRALAERNVVATLLPLTAFALRGNYADARKMMEMGCAVALATDHNPGSCYSGSIPLTFALACIYMGMTVEEAITALTLNGAAALGRADRIGSIEVGKQADFVLLDSDDYHILPYYIGMNCVAATVKCGRVFRVEN
jgi:imidazolonepropionase